MDYSPSPVPMDCPPALKAWLADELRRIASDKLSHVPRLIQLQGLGTEPMRPRDGMIVYVIDPWATVSFSGVEGFYGYEDGNWVKL